MTMKNHAPCQPGVGSAAAKRRTVLVGGGKLVDPLEPDFSGVNLDDLAHNLAGICRYNGAPRRHYSVAQHSVLVSRLLLEQRGYEAARAGLIHDLPEALLGDLIWPLKQLESLRSVYCELEDRLMGAMSEWLRVEWTTGVREDVSWADKCVLLAETRDLFGDPPWARERVGGSGVEAWPSPGRPIEAWTRTIALYEFMFMAGCLGIKGGVE